MLPKQVPTVSPSVPTATSGWEKKEEKTNRDS